MTSSETTSRIMQLANAIGISVGNIQKVISAKGLPSPSFDEDATFNLPLEITQDHDIVLDATAELHDLLLEPLNLIHRHGAHNNLVALGAIAEFKIADLVPSKSSVSFREISEQTPMTEQMTARIMRHAMTMRVFHEPEPGMVAHTAASKILHHSAANDWLQSGTLEMWPAATKTVEALRKWPASQEPSETGYSLSNNCAGTLFDVFAQDSERFQRWERGMAVFSQRPQYSLSYIVDYYDWESLGRAQVIDVGSQAQLSVALADKFSNLSLTAQDMGEVRSGTIPDELQNRVQCTTHNLFTPQICKGADIYSLRWVLHTWSNKYCSQILRALIPALKPGAIILVQETFMPEPGTTATWKEKNLRATDINMAAAFNGQERTVAELKALFQDTDLRFVLKGLIMPAGSALGIMEFIWNGQV